MNHTDSTDSNVSTSNILIVDDTPANLRLLIGILRNSGYKVRPANNGQRALMAIEKECPDLILLDIMMPEMDGYDVCEHLKANEQTRDIPVIFISALSDVFDKVKAFNVGGVDYITKPFQEAEVLARIKTHLALQHMQKQLAAQNFQLQQEVRERQRAEEAIKNIVIGISSQRGEFGENFFDSMVKQLAKTLKADYAFIGELIEGETPCIKTISLCVDGKIVENIKYDLAHTPCENVIDNNVCSYTVGIHRIFPQDILLKKMHVEGYVGISLFDSQNQAFGIMVALYKNPISDPKFAESILQIFAAQTAMEIERQRAEETLKRSENSLKQAQRIAHIGNWEWNIVNNELFWSDEIYRIFGRESQKFDATYDAFFNIVHPDDRAYVQKSLNDAIYEKKPYSIEHRIILPDGEVRFVHEQAVVTFDEDNQAIQMIGTVHDITERKQAEEAKALVRFNQQLSELNKAYERFVPHEFLSLLDKQSIIDVQLGDQVEKEMTILFSDIRHFTAISEKMTPQDNFEFINAYLGQMEPIIHQHKGIIDKYIGDAIMALFPTNADDALNGSIAMLKALTEYNKLLQYTEFEIIHIGIGLHTGKLMLGTIGGQKRMDGTVISDAVNLASRIEGMNKMYGTTLLISEETYSRLSDVSQYAIRTIDKVKVKGKSKPVTIYEVFDGDAPSVIDLKMKTRDNFEAGLIHYRQKAFLEAIQCFQNILHVHPEDFATQIYLKRCEHFQKVGVSDNWDGVEALDHK